jgi:hypothetical protein
MGNLVYDTYDNFRHKLDLAERSAKLASMATRPPVFKFVDP